MKVGTSAGSQAVQYRNQTIAGVALARAAQMPDEVAIYLERGDHVTFAGIVDEARRLAAALVALGLKGRDVVSFQLPNWREAAALDIAASLLDLVINPIVPIYRDRELGFILEDAATRALFIPDQFRGCDFPEMVRRLRGSLTRLEHVIIVRGQRPNEDMLDYARLIDNADPKAIEPAVVDPDELKLLMYTSGTTGRAKAVMHSHNTLTRALDNGVDAWRLAGGDVMLMPSPVTHITGFANGIELPFFSDARSAFMEKWDVDRAIEFISRVGASVCISATPFLQELVQRASEQGIGLPSMRLFVCGGAPVPPALIRSTHRVLTNCRASRAYGSTEAPLVTVGFQKPEEEALAAETDGRCFDWDVQIRGTQDELLDIGQDGEIVVRGPALMLGYRDAGQSREAFTDDGYFRTGDIGHLTPEGAIVITDRKKDLVIRGGENLSAREIEDVLYNHPHVRETAVVAMPHPRLGETVCAYVVMESGCEALTVEALRPFLIESRLAKQKWPERLELRVDLPKTASGKIRKDLLRQEIRSLLEG
jgi:acyl-CoA synthetase (AMP-forming)/AMP-acid ligase II